MRKGIILYQSKYGSAKKYAQWLEQETGYALMETKKAELHQLSGFDVIVMGGGVYASGISGLPFLKKNIGRLSDKKIAVFAVGASPYDEKVIQQLREMHFQNALRKVPLFYCRGAWDEDRMTFGDRMLCRLLQKAVAKQDPKGYEPWQKALMSAVGRKCDWTDPGYLDPLLTCLRED